MGHGGDRGDGLPGFLGSGILSGGDALYRQAGEAWGIYVEGSLGSQVGPAWQPGALLTAQ